MAMSFEPSDNESHRGRCARKGLPLALALMVHLLLALAFYLGRGARGPGPIQWEAFVYLTPNAPHRPANVHLARPLPSASASASANSRIDPIRSATAVAAMVEPSAPAAPAPVPAPAPAADLLEVAAGATLTVKESALREAGRIDRVLHAKGDRAPRLPPETPFSRFQAALAGAFIETSPVLMARHTSPDGVVITRVTQGSKVRCFMSGTVNYAPGLLRDSARPQSVNCPTSGWTPYK
jgi:hypothetical protein